MKYNGAVTLDTLVGFLEATIEESEKNPGETDPLFQAGWIAALGHVRDSVVGQWEAKKIIK